MKRLGAFALLCIFLFNTMGYFVVFKCNQHMLKHEMFLNIRCGIFHTTVVSLKIQRPETNPGFRRIGKFEFIYEGKLYDIAVERRNGDTTFFSCLHDKKEESLLANYELFLTQTGRRGSQQREQPIQALLNGMISQALIQTVTISVPDSWVINNYREYIPDVMIGYHRHVVPPPKSA